MPLELNRTSVFTVKFIGEDSMVHFKDYVAVGTRDAQEQWQREFPTCKEITTFRKA